MRHDHFARRVRLLDPPAKPVANVSADSKSEGQSVAEVQAQNHAVGGDLCVPNGQIPNGDPVPERTERLETCDLPRALGSGAARSHKLDEHETPQSEHGSTGNLARRDIPFVHFGWAK